MRELSVLTESTNEDSTSVKRKIRIFDNPKNLIYVLRARLEISKGLTGNIITTEPRPYRLKWTFLDGKALRIFGLKLTKLSHKTVANLILVMDHIATYFGPKDCLSKQKHFIHYKMEKPRKLTTRQYAELVCDLNSRMA